jgi:hypothetical protein
MALEDTLAYADHASPDAAQAAYSGEWWETRSSEELRSIIRGGLEGGDMFDSAVREMERRSRDMSRRAHDAATAEAQHKTRQATVWGVVVLLGIVAVVAGLLIGRFS